MYLAQQGKPAAMAHAAMLEYCAGEAEGMVCSTDTLQAEAQTLEYIMGCYDTFAAMVEVMPNGEIVMDGDAVFTPLGMYKR